MENPREEVEAVEPKHGSLRKRADEIHTQSNTLQLLTLQWTHLQSHFQSVSEGLLEQEKELVDAREKVRLKEIEVEDGMKLVLEFSREKKDKVSQLGSLKDKILACQSLLSGKHRELGDINQQISGKTVDLGVLTMSVQELACEHKQVVKSISDCTFHLNEVKKLIKKKKKRLRSSLEESINKSTSEFHSQDEKIRLELISKAASLDVFNGKLETCVKNVRLKQAELDASRSKHRKELEEFALQFGDKSVVVVGEHLNECVVKLESRVTQLNSIQSQLLSCHQRLISKDKYLDSELKLLQEKKKQSSSIAAGRSLQSLLNEHFKWHDLVLSEVWTTLLKSPDPAKLVLDEMLGFHPQGKSGEYELRVVRKSCITLLELLCGISPHLKLQVSKQAMELAGAWKSELGTSAANSLQVLGLVKLVSAFRLPSAFQAYGFHCLHKDISSNMKFDVKQEWEALAFAENLLGSYILPPIVAVDQFENPMNQSSGEIMSITNSYEGGFPRQLLPDDPVPSESSTSVLTALRHSNDPANIVFHVIQKSLVQQGSRSIKPYDSRSALKHHVLLLQQLMSVSQVVVSPHVKEAAKNMAVTWRGSLRQETMDILAFLLFLAAYQLAAHFEEDDVLKLAAKIIRYAKAPKLWSDLGLGAKVPGLIRNLVRKDMYVEAARFSCAFQLVDDYPPHLYLLKLLEKSRTFERGKLLLESQCEAFKRHLEFLQRVVKRGRDLKFDHSPVNSKIVEHFEELSKLLETKRECLLDVAGRIQPQRQAGSDQYGHHGATNTIPSYRAKPTDQTSTIAPQPTAFLLQQQNWPWQGGSLTHRGKRNKRPRSGEH
ncbi:FRIGIDA-like protein 5 [Linum grandiflorum]